MLVLSTLARRPSPVLIVGLILSCLLVGCTPDLNWREVRAPAEGYSVMLPGKPTNLIRDIQLLDRKFSMSMQGAQASASSFTVGSVSVMGLEPAQQQRYLSAMREQMLRNISATESSEAMIQQPILDAQARQAGLLPVMRVKAQGKHPRGQALRMHALFALHEDRLVQVVALGESLTDEAAQTFFDSVRWMQMASAGG